MKERIRLILWGTILFATTQGIGILVGLKLKASLEYYQASFPKIYWWQFLILFGIISLIIGKLPKIVKSSDRLFQKIAKKKTNFPQLNFNRTKEKIKIQSWWQVGFSAMIGLVGYVILGLFFRQPQTIILAVILGLAWLFFSRVWCHNFSIMLLLAFFGIVFGFSISFRDILIVLGILAVYDFLAVYKFKFMVGLLENMIKSGIILGLIIPRLRISDFNAKLEEAVSDFGVSISKDKPERFSLVGGGDVGLPLALTVSVLVNLGLSNALIVASFSVMGVIVAYFIYFYKKEKPLPALFPIAGFAIIGFLVSSII